MSSIEPAAKFRQAVRTMAVSGHDEAEPDAADVQHRSLSEMAQEVASQFSDQPVSPSLVSGTLRLIELSAILLTGLVLAQLDPSVQFSLVYLATIILGSIFALLFIQAADGYQVILLKSQVAQIGRTVGCWTLVFLLIAAAGLVMGRIEFVAPSWLLSWYVAGVGLFTLSRIIVGRMVRDWIGDGRLERRAVIVGGGPAAAELIQSIESQRNSDIRICGIFDDRADDRSPAMVKGYPKLGNVADLIEFGRITGLDMLIVTIPFKAENRVLDLLSKLWVLPVDIHLSAHADKLRFRPRSYTYLGNVPMLAVFDKPLADWDAVAKRMFDIVFGTLAIVATSPIMIGAAIAVKLDSKGPVLFRQKRYGFNNEVVDVWKFRSMYTDKSDADAKQVVTKGDPRVTKVGRFIRKTSIDELPQLFNVLAGSLSLVGPRPHALKGHTQNKLFEQVVDGYFARHRVKPGVTGWAQINGWRGEVDTPEKIRKRVECDLYYIENWSLLLDFKILFLTPFRIIGQEGAY